MEAKCGSKFMIFCIFGRKAGIHFSGKCSGASRLAESNDVIAAAEAPTSVNFDEDGLAGVAPIPYDP